MGEFDDFTIEDLKCDEEPKKKKNSGIKGKRVELQLCKDLNKRFEKILSKNPEWGEFSRSVGSGNRWGQKVSLSKAAKETYTGDVTCPTNFKFTIESKGGYNDIDLVSAFDGGHKELDKFLEQAKLEAGRSSQKTPLLVWKKDRKPRLVAFDVNDFNEFGLDTMWEKIENNVDYRMEYREWCIISFDEFFSFSDSYYFEELT